MKCFWLTGKLTLGDATIPGTMSKPTGLQMLAFDKNLDNAQIATVVTYIRNAWKNRASAISADDVSDMRKQKKQKDDSSGLLIK